MQEAEQTLHGEIVSLTTYRDGGFLAAAFRNFPRSARLVGSEETRDLFSDELIQKFSLAGGARSSAIFTTNPQHPNLDRRQAHLDERRDIRTMRSPSCCRL